MRYMLGALDYSAGDTIATIHSKVATSIAASLNGFAEVNTAYEFSASGATITASKKAGTTADLSFEYRAQSVYVNTSYKLDITDEATNSLTLKYFNPLTNATSKPSAPTPVVVYKATLDVTLANWHCTGLRPSCNGQRRPYGHLERCHQRSILSGPTST